MLFLIFFFVGTKLESIYPLTKSQKNQPGKIIILYDETEQTAPDCATTLVQRGYDNIFLLSGGKFEFHSLMFSLIDSSN